MKFLLLSLFLAIPAKADIVFFDLNFSPVEITAVTAAAKARGERAHIFPARTPDQQRELDKYYRLVDSLQKKVRSCKGEKCGELIRQFDQAHEHLLALADQVRKVENGELERIFSELDAKGITISTLIFSGHSGGTGQVGGLLGGIEVQQVRQAFDRYPRLLEPVKAMLLWGCYSGTLHSLNGIWQKNFPTVGTWGGFENRSPLGIRESSGRFLKSFLLSEEKLRAARGLKEMHRIFRSLDLVAELDGTAVVRDMYFTYDEAALVSEMLKRCGSFNPRAMEIFECYENGKAGCENPPVDHRGPLREMYNFLQKNRHCRGGLKEKYPTLPSLEYLIRLIYLDNVKKNFAAHHAEESGSFERILGGIQSAPPLADFGGSSRAEDIGAFSLIQRGLNAFGARDLSVVDRADWKPILLAITAKEVLTNILGPSLFRSWDQSCVPFSWVDPGSREKDSCGLSKALQFPLPETMESELLASLAHSHIDKFLLDRCAENFWVPIPAEKDAWVQQVKSRVAGYVDHLEKLADPSALEGDRLETARSKLARLEGMRASALAAEEAIGLRSLLSLVDEKIEWAKSQAHGTFAKTTLEQRKLVIQQRIYELDRIAQGLRPSLQK